MKRKVSIFISGLLILSIMNGCSSSNNDETELYIGKDSAYSVALEAAGINIENVENVNTQLTEKDGIAYYKVDFNSDGVTYNYSIDAVTGIVIETNNTDFSDNDNTITDYDKLDTDNSKSSATTEKKDNYNINDNKATVSDNMDAFSNEKEITLEKAKQIALKHSNQTKSNVTFVKEYKDFDDGVWVYEIEFIVKSKNYYKEYDYEIDAYTGKIISYDYDAESYTPQDNKSNVKTEEEARKIALAKVPGSKPEHCSIHLDSDDGKLIYEGKIIYEFTEYEFEIDAYSGTILEWEAESIQD